MQLRPLALALGLSALSALAWAEEPEDESSAPVDETTEESAPASPVPASDTSRGTETAPASSPPPTAQPVEDASTEPTAPPVPLPETDVAAAESPALPGVQLPKPLMLYNGDLAVALTRASNATKIDDEKFKPVTIRDIAGGKPILDGPGTLDVCRGKTADNRSIRSIKKKVLKNIVYVNYEEADKLLQTATNYLNCLSEPLIGLDAAEVFFMKGFLDYELGRQGLAQDSFRRALVYDEEMEWDSNFPKDALDLFEAAQSAHERSEASASVRLTPAPAEGTAWLDGETIDSADGVIELLPGTHLLQFSVPQVYTVSLYVKENSKLTLMLPALVPNEAVAWVNDPDERAKLKLLLGAMLESEQEVYVSNGGEVWLYTPDRDSWEELIVPTGFFAANPERMGNYYATQGLFWSGAVAIGTGGVFGLVSLNNRRDAQAAYDSATSYLAREEARNQYELARANTGAGLGIFITGDEQAGTAFAIQANGKPKVRPYWSPNGRGCPSTSPTLAWTFGESLLVSF